MGLTTARWALPYPVGTDIPDVPNWMNQLAVALDNVAMDDQGTLAARPAAAKRGRYYQVRGDSDATQNGRLWRDNGTGWDEIVTAVPTVTALPSTPYDGQEIRLLVDAANGIAWHLKYRAGSASAYKWEFIGGNPLLSNTAVRDLAGSYTQINTTSYTTILDTITLPNAGDYLMEHGGSMTSAPGSTNSYIGLHINGVLQSALEMVGSASTPEWRHLVTRQNALAAAAVITLRTRVDTVNALAKYGSHWIKLTPFRIG